MTDSLRACEPQHSPSHLLTFAKHFTIFFKNNKKKSQSVRISNCCMYNPLILFLTTSWVYVNPSVTNKAFTFLLFLMHQKYKVIQGMQLIHCHFYPHSDTVQKNAQRVLRKRYSRKSVNAALKDAHVRSWDNVTSCKSAFWLCSPWWCHCHGKHFHIHASCCNKPSF